MSGVLALRATEADKRSALEALGVVMCTDRERVGCMGWSRDEAETREGADGMERGEDE